MDVEFLVNVSQMPADTLDGDTQPTYDFFVGETANDEIEDFAFTGRKLFHVGGGGFLLLKVGNDLAGNFTAHRHASGLDIANSCQNLLGRGTFEQIATCPCAQGAKYTVGI